MTGLPAGMTMADWCRQWGYVVGTPEAADAWAAKLAFVPIRLPQTIMGDSYQYQSLQDRSQIDGRAQHREHLKRHDLVELGDAPTRSMEPEKYERKVDWAAAVGENYAELKVTGKIDD
jgi:hypothetical protein